MAIAPGVKLIAPGVPDVDSFVESKCHYTDVPIKALANLAWYQADPASGVVLAGWKCAACGLTVSEDGRKKENLGGKNAKGDREGKMSEMLEQVRRGSAVHSQLSPGDPHVDSGRRLMAGRWLAGPICALEERSSSC